MGIAERFAVGRSDWLGKFRGSKIERDKEGNVYRE